MCGSPLCIGNRQRIFIVNFTILIFLMLPSNCTHTAQLHTHPIYRYAPLSSYIMRTVPHRHAIWPGCPVPTLQGNAYTSGNLLASLHRGVGMAASGRVIRAQYLKKQPACEQCGSEGEPHPAC